MSYPLLNIFLKIMLFMRNESTAWDVCVWNESTAVVCVCVWNESTAWDVYVEWEHSMECFCGMRALYEKIHIEKTNND